MDQKNVVLNQENNYTQHLGLEHRTLNNESLASSITNKKAPLFYKWFFTVSKVKVLVWSILFIGFILVALIFSLLIFAPSVAKNWNLDTIWNHSDWYILLLVYPLCILGIFFSILSFINHSKFAFEYKKVKNNFPNQPTKYVQSMFLKYKLAYLNYNWFLGIVYVYASVLIIFLVLYIFNVNAFYFSDYQKSSSVLPSLYLYGKVNGEVVVVSTVLRKIIIFAGIILAASIILHMTGIIVSKSWASKIDNYYINTPVIDGAYLETKKANINKRNKWIFLSFIILLFVLIFIAYKFVYKRAKR